MTRPAPQPVSRRERRAQARYERPAAPKRRTARRSVARPAWRSPVVLTSVGALAVGAVIIAFASGVLGGSGGGGTLTTPPISLAGLPVDGSTLGKADAPITMEVYSDFQCPACKLFITTELPSLITDFVQPGFVRIVSKDIDIIDRGAGTESLELAAAAFCAGEQGKYWDFHDWVFWNQGRENKGDHNAAWIQRVATAAGLDMTAWQACDARSDIRQPVKDATNAAAALGITGTPTLRINGQVASGVPSYADLKTYLTSLLATTSPSPTVVPTAAPATEAPSTPAPAAS